MTTNIKDEFKVSQRNLPFVTLVKYWIEKYNYDLLSMLSKSFLNHNQSQIISYFVYLKISIINYIHTNDDAKSADLQKERANLGINLKLLY